MPFEHESEVEGDIVGSEMFVNDEGVDVLDGEARLARREQREARRCGRDYRQTLGHGHGCLAHLAAKGRGIRHEFECFIGLSSLEGFLLSRYDFTRYDSPDGGR